MTTVAQAPLVEAGLIVPEAGLAVIRHVLAVPDQGLSIVGNQPPVPSPDAPTDIAPGAQLLSRYALGMDRDSFWRGKKLSTGNHMSDCLALWYGPELGENTVDTFRELDSKVRAAIGELAMVVLRREEHGRLGSIVGTQYQIGRLIGDVGLYMELEGAQVKLPTEESYRVVTLPSGGPGLASLPTSHPMIVHQMLDLASGQHDPVLPFNSIDLVRHQQGPTIDPDRTDPPVNIDPNHALEATKPPLEIIIGSACVMSFLGTDPALQRHLKDMNLTVADFLLQNFPEPKQEVGPEGQTQITLVQT